MTVFGVKDWKNATTHEGGGDTSTPISAAALEDLETRVTSSGGRTITAASADDQPLTLKAAVAQTADLFKVTNSAAASLLAVGASGELELYSAGTKTNELTNIGGADISAAWNLHGSNATHASGVAWQIAIDVAHATPHRDFVIDRWHADGTVNDFFVLWHNGDANCPLLGIGGGDDMDAVVNISAQSDHLNLTNLVLSNPPSGTQTGSALIVRNSSDEDVFKIAANGGLTIYDQVANGNALLFDPYNRHLDLYSEAVVGERPLRFFGTGEAHPRLAITGNARIQFGDGTASPSTELYYSAGYVRATDFQVDAAFYHRGTQIGFFNTTGIAKQEVTGSRGGNAALASLLTALETYGLITDSST